MKSIALLSLLVLGVYAAPGGDYGYGQEARVPSYASGYESAPAVRKPVVPIVRLVHNDNNGEYSLDVQSGDGQQQQESGVLKDLGDKEGAVSVKTGSYSFKAPDGKTYSVNWKSDENGFQAQGEHLPTPHPIPEEIRKSIEQNLREEQAGAPQYQ